MCVRKATARKLKGRWLRLVLWTLQFLRRIWLKLTFSSTVCHPRLIKRSRNYRNIPESKGWPIIGTMLQFIKAGGAQKLHEYIDNRHREFGEIFRERLGGSTNTYIFVSSASLMRSVFLHEGQYPWHPLPEAWTLYNQHFKCERGLFFMKGTEWLHNRRLLNRFLLNGNLNWMNTYIEAPTAKLVNEWKHHIAMTANNSSYVVHNLEHRLYRWAVDVICTIMFGQIAVDCPKIDALLDEFSKIVHNVFEKSTPLMNFPPRLAKSLHLLIWRDFETSVTCVLGMGSKIIDAFLTLTSDDNIATTLPGTNAAESLFQRLQGAKVSLQTIKRIFVDLVIAAGDTTAYSSAWALSLVSQHPVLQTQLAADAIHTNYSPLIHGLIKETLRLYPVAPFIGRYLANDAVIDGYHIKKDTLVILSLFTAGRDSKHFPEPLAVKPERWLRDEASGNLAGVLQAHGSLPFAIGNRSCIGRKIAMNQMQCLLTAIISSFELTCLNTEPIKPILRMVTVPNAAIKLQIKFRETA